MSILYFWKQVQPLQEEENVSQMCKEKGKQWKRTYNLIMQMQAFYTI